MHTVRLLILAPLLMLAACGEQPTKSESTNNLPGFEEFVAKYQPPEGFEILADAVLLWKSPNLHVLMKGKDDRGRDRYIVRRYDDLGEAWWSRPGEPIDYEMTLYDGRYWDDQSSIDEHYRINGEYLEFHNGEEGLLAKGKITKR